MGQYAVSCLINDLSFNLPSYAGYPHLSVTASALFEICEYKSKCLGHKSQTFLGPGACILSQPNQVLQWRFAFHL